MPFVGVMPLTKFFVPAAVSSGGLQAIVDRCSRGVQGSNADFSNKSYNPETLQMYSHTSNLESSEVWLYDIDSLLPSTMAVSSVKSSWS